ncbi:lipid-A-disaccharide synthase [Desulfurobacterium thermolithotrophum]|uniref:lipid-A-disaccharide synthase n=1 Tax=Desulfurobacterium thermolithotrophum TaxID=64160 RepID=UPI0013D6CB24|nr:lipid-A-disaccharide synthase [Desulfurobacterium thermolithotrophum]
MKKILIVTGELSGFNYVKELIPCFSEHLKVYGVLLDEVPGAERILDSKELIAFGLFESLSKLPSIWRGKKIIEKFLEEKKPDAVLLVDFPGFNLKIAEIAKKKGIKVFYFISPKFWAWGERRIEKIKKFVDRMFVIFPFEVELYQRYAVNVTYVGNPLKDIVRPVVSSTEFRKKYDLKEPVFALMPGSRFSEIKYLLEPMLEVSKRIEGTFVLPVASSIERNYMEAAVKRINPEVFLIPEEERYNLLFSADAGIIASGTASLEAAIAGLPHVVVYKLHPLTFAIARRVVKISFVSLPNIIAGEEVVPELLQERANPEDITLTLLDVYKNKEFIKKLLKEKVSSKLTGGAIKKLCQEILKEV